MGNEVSVRDRVLRWRSEVQEDITLLVYPCWDLSEYGKRMRTKLLYIVATFSCGLCAEFGKQPLQRKRKEKRHENKLIILCILLQVKRKISKRR